MLNFWYSTRCSRELKLALCIAVCAMIYYCSSIQQLSPLFAGLCLAVGMGIHINHVALQKLSEDHPYAQTLKIFAKIWPIIALICICLNLAKVHQAVLALQCIGFSAIGLFLLSIYENRAKRFE